MSRTEIDGDQVQDETLTGSDVLDNSLKAVDLDIEDVATGIAADPAASSTIINLIKYGQDAAHLIKDTQQNFSGGSFQTYSELTFNVSEGSPNEYRANIDFIWGHNSASNDIRFRVEVDGVYTGQELRIEPKDAGTDQRYQNAILLYLENLSAGSHTVALTCRPASANRESRLYRSTIEVWRIK